MMKLFACMLALTLVCGFAGAVRADDAADAKAIVDKAIKALGGEEALGKVKAASWKAKTTRIFNGNESEGTTEVVMQDLDHYRQVITGQFNGNQFKGVTVISGDKGARKFGDMERTDLDGGALANQKRTAYLTIIPVTILNLRDKNFKLEPIAEEKVGDKPAVGLNVIAPDKRDFKIYFDKESGLPVRTVAKVMGFGNQGEFTQETDYTDYKDMGGIKKATKSVAKRNGERFVTTEITEFKVLDKVEPKLFTEVE